MHNRPEVLAFVWVYPNQRGFQPFICRLRSLLANFDTLVVVNDATSIPNLELPPDRCLDMPCRSSSLGALAGYGLRMAALLARLRPERTVFLASIFAPFVAVARPARSALFWDEHPLHAYPQQPRGRPVRLKRIKNAAMLRLCYAGARAAGALMPTGVDMVEDLRRHGCPSVRIHDIPLGVDPLFTAAASRGREPSQPKTDRLRVLCVGRLTEDRAGPLLFDALAVVNREGIKVDLSILGADAWDRAYIAKRSADPAIRDALTIRERPPRDAYIAQLHQADAGYCLIADTPYRFGVQTKIFEFLAAGLPVLANDIPTSTRYLEHGRNSWIVKYSAASLAEALEMLWRERDTLLPRLRAGAEESGRAYLWPALEPRFLNIIRSL
jgi:glycosyltransferase involved in cell wall biosynthesis